jgi:hypothetical protein
MKGLQMKFSENTMSILKNFSSINQSIVFKAGNELRTISPQKTVMAIATIEDEIPSNACVYDLSRFLSAYSLYGQPTLEFNEKNFVISEGRRKTKYTYAEPSMVITPPDKEIKIPSVDVQVDIEWSDLQSVIKASGILQLPEVAFVGEGGVCYLRAIDSGNPTADTFGVELGETNDTFTLIIKTENLKILPKNYKVSLSSAGISKFEAEGLMYFIAIESKSTYKKGE